MEFTLEKYGETIVKLNEILDKLKVLEGEYIIEYQKYKEKKQALEKEGLRLKEEKELKTLKDVEVWINEQLLKERAELARKEANIKYLNYEKQKLQNIAELIKMGLILDKRVEKELEKTQGL